MWRARGRERERGREVEGERGREGERERERCCRGWKEVRVYNTSIIKRYSWPATISMRSREKRRGEKELYLHATVVVLYLTSTMAGSRKEGGGFYRFFKAFWALLLLPPASR